MKHIFDLVRFQLRKKTNILSILIIGIAMSITIINYVNNESEKYMYENDVFDALEYRTLRVGKENDNNSKYIDELEKKEHINIASYSFEYFGFGVTVDEFNKGKLTGEFRIIPANNDSLPKIVDGTNFPDDDNYYMICPENFYPVSAELKNFSIFDKLNISKYIGKEISARYIGMRYFNYNDPTNVFYTRLKVIGTYKNNDYNIDEYTCYVNKKAMHKMVLNQYIDDEENYELQKSQGFVIEIDSKENIDIVTKELESEGYYVEPTVYFDEEGLKEIQNQTNKISIPLIIIVVVLIVIILEKDYLENKDYYKELNILGYNKGNIRRVYLLSNFIKILLCIILGIILSSIICGLAYLLLKMYPFMMFKYRVVIPCGDIIKLILLFIVIPFIITFISSIIHLRKVGKYD